MRWDVARQSGVDLLVGQFAADGLTSSVVGPTLTVELPGDDADVIMAIEQFARDNDVMLIQIPDWTEPQ